MAYFIIVCIFILIRYVATITMKAFSDEALLKIVVKHWLLR